MNKRWIVRGASVVGIFTVLSVATPAFAATVPEGPGNGKEATQSSALTMSCNPGSVAGGNPKYVCTVSNIAQTKADTTLVFRALNSQQYGNFSQNSFGKAGSNNRSHDDSGTILNGLSGVTITPSPTNQKFTSSTEKFTISGDLPSNTVAVTVGQYSPDRTKEYADEGLVKLTPPAGQMPEVPYTAGLPVVALGLGMLAWRRVRRNPA